MDEPKTDINQIIGNIIKAKFFNQQEQKALSDLFEKEGVSEVFFQKLKEMFEMAVKRAVQKGQPIIADFDEQTEMAEREMQEQRSGLLAELKNKLSQIPDDDFEQRGKLLQEHSRMVSAQYRTLEQKIRDIAAKILTEQIKTAD